MGFQSGGGRGGGQFAESFIRSHPTGPFDNLTDPMSVTNDKKNCFNAHPSQQNFIVK
jgi:hypothetical protein